MSETENKFTQLCVMHGTVLEEKEQEDFLKFFQDNMGVRVKYHTQVKTNPDLDSEGNPVPETGGRNDLFFFIHSDDVVKFAIPRLQMGIRWWEDVISYNDNSHLYTKEFIKANPVTW